MKKRSVRSSLDGSLETTDRKHSLDVKKRSEEEEKRGEKRRRKEVERRRGGSRIGIHGRPRAKHGSRIKFVRAQRLPNRANAAWIPIRDPWPIGTQARTTMDPDSGSMVVRPWSCEK